MDRDAPNSKAPILVVEDEALIRIWAADLLEEDGFSVIEAKDADAALKVLEARPDVRLLFTDVQMPGRASEDRQPETARNRNMSFGTVAVPRAVPSCAYSAMISLSVVRLSFGFVMPLHGLSERSLRLTANEKIELSSARIVRALPAGQPFVNCSI